MNTAAAPQPPTRLSTNSGTVNPASTLQDAWELWFAAPRAKGEGANSSRTQSDLGNHRRALELFAFGTCGTLELSQVLLKELALEPEFLRERLLSGSKDQAAVRKRALPSEKTLANLTSNLLRIQGDLEPQLELPEFTPKTGHQLRKALPSRARRTRLARDAWPQSLLDDYEQYTTYRTDPYYAGLGREYRGKPVRQVTANSYKARLGQYVRFCLEEEKLQDLRFEHLVDFDRFHRYRAWYFRGQSEGGYDGFKSAAVALGVLAQYLCAVGRAFPEHKPDSRTKDAPWTVFYALGRSTKVDGASRGKLVTRTTVPHMTPTDVSMLGECAWSTPPRQRWNSGSTLYMTFGRKRAAMFFLLAPFMPVRRKNWTNMQWGKNLFQKRDGTWVVHFKGEELKVGQRKGAVNVYGHDLPPTACASIERWRAYLAEVIGPDFEQRAPFVLPARKKRSNPDGSFGWTKCVFHSLPTSIGNTCLELREHDFPMHQIRHIVATYLVNNSTSLEDAQAAADLLGDTLETVLATYYRPNRDALRRSYFARLEAEIKTRS